MDLIRAKEHIVILFDSSDDRGESGLSREEPPLSLFGLFHVV